MEQIRKYKARLDYYYKLLAIYLLFLVVYSILKGSFVSGEFSLTFHDPIIYMTMLFIIIGLIAWLTALIRGKELEFLIDRFILKNRFGSREILNNDVISVKFSREKKRYKEEKSEIKRVRIKLKDRHRLLRIRVSEFYDERKLINEFKNLSKVTGKVE
jgi:hypothetical protein